MAEQKYVVFRLEQEFYGIGIERVERILADQTITKVPRAPKLLLGIFDMRGETVPAVDLRKRFEMKDFDGAANFVVVSTEAGRCALRVDAVDGIIVTEDTAVETPGALLDSANDPVVAGIVRHQERIVVLLNPDEVVHAELQKAVAKHQKAA
jgi:purine-binding chemotaxis protein CheW